jgi:hypothetical protein
MLAARVRVTLNIYALRYFYVKGVYWDPFVICFTMRCFSFQPISWEAWESHVDHRWSRSTVARTLIKARIGKKIQNVHEQFATSA